MPTRVRSHAKINLGLSIGAPRPNSVPAGFHELVTVYQTLAIHDFVTVSARPAPQTSIRLTSNHTQVPTDNRNTAWKMTELALESLQIRAEVEIHIEKRLPVQGGLGAGSANAVAALIGLERELSAWNNNWNNKELGAPSIGRSLPDGWDGKRLDLAAKVGSDVPLFLIGGAVLGLERGQEVYPLPDFEPLWCVIAAPSIGVSTPEAFRAWDELCAAQGLTAEASAGKLKQLSRAYASAFSKSVEQAGSSGVLPNGKNLAGPQQSALVRTGITSWIQNDFEEVVFPQQPSLREIKRLLAAPGKPEAALCAQLSGSGSALYGLYLTQSAAEAALMRLSRFTEIEVSATLTQTVPRSVYWAEMLS